MERTKKFKLPWLIKQSLAVNKGPIPWEKAFSAGLASFLPIFIGIYFGNLQYGALAGLGSFAYLYVFNIPYAQRAKKLFSVVVGLSFVTGLATIAAPYPLAIAILMGIIGMVVVFVFGSLKILGPSAIFFVLVFSMTTAMPIDQELAPLRAGLVLLGGAFSWFLAMIGWFFNPHGPETSVVKRVYLELASFIDSVGTADFEKGRHDVMVAMKQAEETLVAGYIPWRTTDKFKRLYLLNDHANKIFMFILEHSFEKGVRLPSELGEMVRVLANSLDDKKKAEPIVILQPDNINETVSQLFSKIYDADAIMNEPISKVDKELRISKTSLKTIFLGTFDKNSIVFISSLRYGIVLTIAAIIAYQFDFERSFWVPLSCAAVMSGTTLVATFHRSIQRSFGTIIGVLFAGLILSLQPEGIYIALSLFFLTFLTELCIVRNYGLAVMFFTPSALIMAEITSQGTFSHFATARITDIIVGSMIGLIGVSILGRRSASDRIPHLISKTIRSQGQYLLALFSQQRDDFDGEQCHERIKMETNLLNLKTLYNTATGELPVHRKALDFYWPIIFHIEHLSHLLITSSKEPFRPNLSDEELAQLIYSFEVMAYSANRLQSPSIKVIPEIEGFPSIYKEITSLQKALQTSDKGAWRFSESYK